MLKISQNMKKILDNFNEKSNEQIILHDKIKGKYQNIEFFILFCGHEDFGIFRFHVIRENEPLWTDVDFIDKTEELIICIFDE